MSLVVKKNDSQYTDFLLAVALYQYMRSVDKNYILSADIKAFPMSLFDTDGIITLENSDEKTAHLYLIVINQEKYTSIAGNIKTGKI